jgi:primary-amine oxidase
VVTWNYVANVQPAIMLDEFLECEQACKASPEWQAAMRKRGITNFDLCMVDPWSAGNFGIEAEAGRRLARALTWVRSRPDDNGRSSLRSATMNTASTGTSTRTEHSNWR